MKMWVAVVTNTEELGNYAFPVGINDHENVHDQLNRYVGIVSSQLCESRKKAVALADHWNRCFVENGSQKTHNVEIRYCVCINEHDGWQEYVYPDSYETIEEAKECVMMCYKSWIELCEEAELDNKSWNEEMTTTSAWVAIEKDDITDRVPVWNPSPEELEAIGWKTK